MNATEHRDRQRVVTLFALTGAALGVVLAMLCLTKGGDGFGQTDIGASTLLTLLTTVFSASAGKVLSERPGSVERWVTVSVLVLTFLLGAAMGWLVGDSNAARHLPASPGRSAALGGLAGLPVGLVVLAPRWFRRARD